MVKKIRALAFIAAVAVFGLSATGYSHDTGAANAQKKPKDRVEIQRKKEERPYEIRIWEIRIVWRNGEVVDYEVRLVAILPKPDREKRR